MLNAHLQAKLQTQSAAALAGKGVTPGARVAAQMDDLGNYTEA